MDNTKQKNMGTFLKNAKKVMEKSDAMSPLPQKNIPTLNQLPTDIMIENLDQYETGYQNQNYQPAFDGSYTKASGNLPSAILNSLTANPISDYGQMGGLSVLDSFMPAPQTQQRQPQGQQRPIQRQQINEQYYPDEKQMPTTEEMLMKSRAMHEQINPQQQRQQTQMMPTGGAAIDYSLIKLMIENCIAEQFKSLKQTMLTESKNNGANGEIIMTVGNTIRFIRKDGEIFEGKIKDTGRNINE